MNRLPLIRPKLVAAVLLGTLTVACGSDGTGPQIGTDRIVLTADMVHSLDSTGQAIKQANAGNATLQALIDSTLLVLSAGVEARRLDVTTDLTTSPLYFIGVHRPVSRPSGGSFSTWTLVGFDDPSHLRYLVEVSGFAENATATAPTTVSGTIGDGSGIVNALMLQVGNGGTVTQWNAGSGTVSFQSDAPGGACPNFTPPNNMVTCALETMHVKFSATATSQTSGAGTRQATLATETDAPGMRLSYTP